jgi:hypothetical protein
VGSMRGEEGKNPKVKEMDHREYIPTFRTSSSCLVHLCGSRGARTIYVSMGTFLRAVPWVDIAMT